MAGKRKKYTLSLVDERTLERLWHIHLTRSGVFVVSGLFFLFMIGLFSCLILFTPVRQLLPGNSVNLRNQLVEESVRADSLMQVLEVHNRYLESLKQAMVGEISTDTMQSLDSLQIVMREQLLEAKSEAIADYMLQYEQKEKDNLLLFDVQMASTYHFYRPGNGVITRSYDPRNQFYGIELRMPAKEAVLAVLGGTIVSQELELDNSYTIVLLHDSYLSIYRQVARPLHRVGDVVSAGESIAIAADEQPLQYELWQNGHSINPQDVMVL